MTLCCKMGHRSDETQQQQDDPPVKRLQFLGHARGSVDSLPRIVQSATRSHKYHGARKSKPAWLKGCSLVEDGDDEDRIFCCAHKHKQSFFRHKQLATEQLNK